MDGAMVVETFISPQERETCRREIRGTIGRVLQAYYRGCVDDPMPERLTSLLTRLDDEAQKN
jgi:Anti-sigma factor NepR